MLLLWVVITSAGPFMFISFPWHPQKLLTIGGLVVMMGAILITKRPILLKNKQIYFILLIQTCFMIFASIYHDDPSYRALFLQLLGILVTLMFVQNRIGMEQLASSLLVVTIIMCMGGALAFVLTALGIIEQYSIVPRFGRPGGYIYNYILTFSNSVYFYSGYQVIRIAGYFDEPGTMAFYVVHALLLNKLYKNNRRFELILLISGLFTLSLAYYFSIASYLLLFNVKLQRIRSLVVLVFAMFILNSVSVNFFKKVDIFSYISDAIGARIELSGEDSNKIFKGDTRTGSMIRDYPLFKEKPLLGRGNTEGSNSPTIMGFLVNDGLIGFGFIFMLPLFLMSKSIYSYKNRSYFNSVVIRITLLLFMNYIQRPFVTGLLPNMFYVAMIYCAVRMNQERAPQHMLKEDSN